MKLREALSLSKDEQEALQKDILEKAKASDINAYVGFETSGSGLPILLKDNIQVKEWSVTCGSKILEGYIAPYDATVVTKLKEAGLAPTVRANLDEFAMGSTTESSCYGPTKNPHDISRLPGGRRGG
ncbi:MAG TPA: Asp-tRNA(Asn)/Glu-tRNA(Gln) amidotransferase subunit GatA, partial [Nitratifractor sp.]|nr:Asp-tRNA(Asn)/Glu-tRNA(Gln) amidotransferase subunit GatA [Nitratifractor sp.]